MKRLFLKVLGVFACLIMTIFIAKTAQADLIWTPNDEFYFENHKECERLERSYTANGEEGYVEIKKNPKSKETVENVGNGAEFYVSFTYTDEKDRIWGVVEQDGSSGWILMKDLVVIYDGISFMEEHKGDIQAYRGEFDDYVQGEEPIQFYDYPGSGTPRNAIMLQEDKPKFQYAYEDEEGRLWGLASYYYANRGWICLSDPTNGNIPGIQKQPQATIIPPVSEVPDPSDSTGSTEIIILAIAVVVLVIGTGVIIRIFWKKK